MAVFALVEKMIFFLSLRPGDDADPVLCDIDLLADMLVHRGKHVLLHDCLQRVRGGEFEIRPGKFHLGPLPAVIADKSIRDNAEPDALKAFQM